MSGAVLAPAVWGAVGEPGLKGTGHRKKIVGYAYMYKYAVFDIKLAYKYNHNFFIQFV